MKASTIATILSISATALAVPRPSYALTKRQLTGVQKAQADCQSGSNPDPDTCLNVVNAINDWDSSVNTVNDFLNNGASFSTDQDNDVLTAALKEPGFLTTLRNTPNLDASGQGAASTLDAFFPFVPGNLTDLVNGNTDFQTAANGINDARCNHVLEAIGDLWISAAAAAGADTPGRPLGPVVCISPNGNVGDAYSSLS